MSEIKLEYKKSESLYSQKCVRCFPKLEWLQYFFWCMPHFQTKSELISMAKHFTCWSLVIRNTSIHNPPVHYCNGELMKNHLYINKCLMAINANNSSIKGYHSSKNVYKSSINRYDSSYSSRDIYIIHLQTHLIHQSKNQAPHWRKPGVPRRRAGACSPAPPARAQFTIFTTSWPGVPNCSDITTFKKNRNGSLGQTAIHFASHNCPVLSSIPRVWVGLMPIFTGHSNPKLYQLTNLCCLCPSWGLSKVAGMV